MLARVRKIILKSFFYFILLTNIIVITFKFFPIPITMLMIIRTIEQGLDNNRNIKLEKTWTPFSQIPNDVKLAVICAEDQNFMEHEGFDLDAIENAIQKNKTSKQTKGASTISQQTAKIFFYGQKEAGLEKA
jgi:monofunctional biosynthetic peptidoglycan transglycosylase